MLRKVLFLVLGVVSVSSLTACWSRSEMNDLAVAVGMGIDKVGDQFRVSVQVVVPGEVAAKKGRGSSPVMLIKTEADTIMEASRRLTTVSPRKIYFSHLRVFVLGESLAREGMGKTLDFLSRDHEFRNDFYILVAREGSAENTLKIMTTLEQIPATYLFTSLESSEKNWSPSTTVTLDELITTLISSGKQPVLTGLAVIGNPELGNSRKNTEQIESPGRLKISGLAVFKKDKLLGWLNENESRGYNFILDNVNSSVGRERCPDGGNAAIEIIRSKTDMKGLVSRGVPRIEIHVRVNANVGEVECRKLDLTRVNTFRELEKTAAHTIESRMESVIEKAQTVYKSDIFGFGGAIRRSNPKAWNTLKEDWNDRHFVRLPVKIRVDVKLRHSGTVSDSFLTKMKE